MISCSQNAKVNLGKPLQKVLIRHFITPLRAPLMGQRRVISQTDVIKWGITEPVTA